ncbi:chorismate mutase [Stetteria hydrogenophila]
MAAREVEDIRRAIDWIDAEILRLLEERMRLCRAIGEAKRRAGAPVRDPGREEEVLRRAGRFRSVFEEIVRLCREEQEGC